MLQVDRDMGGGGGGVKTHCIYFTSDKIVISVLCLHYTRRREGHADYTGTTPRYILD